MDGFEPELFAGPLYYDPTVGGYCLGPRADKEIEPMSLATCATCRYFRPPVRSHNKGQCHRYPPGVILIPETDEMIAVTESSWPPVPPYESCGEHKPIADPNAIDANG